MTLREPPDTLKELAEEIALAVEPISLGPRGINHDRAKLRNRALYRRAWGGHAPSRFPFCLRE